MRKEPTGKKSRRRQSAEFKARVTTAALREDKNPGPVSLGVWVHSLRISTCKKQALAAMLTAFRHRPEQRVADALELDCRPYNDAVYKLKEKTFRQLLGLFGFW